MNIPLYKIYSDEEDVDKVSKIIERKSFWAGGPENQQFEDCVKEYLENRKYAVAFNSGTSALHATLLAYNFTKGSEIIVPSFTFISTATSPMYVDCIPRFADINKETYALDPISIDKCITNKTSAIMPIHYGGRSCLIEEIKEIAEDNKLILIEDATESLGAETKSKKVGTYGDVSILSFTGNKLITCGEGGMIVTDSKKIYEKIRAISSHGIVNENGVINYRYVGYNWRMSTITAALGLSQFKKIDLVIEMRRKNANYLNNKLNKINGIEPPIEDNININVYQMYTIKVTEGRKIRNSLMKHLLRNGISCKIYFPPVHKYKIFNKIELNDDALINTNYISDRVLTLPMYPTLSKKEMDYMVKNIEEFMETCK